MNQTSRLDEHENIPIPKKSNPWIELGGKNKIRDGVYFIGSDEIWITMVHGQRIAVSNICPHKMGPISKGKINGSLVRCPWHGYWFDVATGKCTPSLRLRKYELKEEAGTIFVKLIDA